VVVVGDVVVVNDGRRDAYVARFAPDGALRWLTTIDGGGAERLEIGAAATLGDEVVVAAQLQGVLAAPLAESLGAPRPVLVRLDGAGVVVGATVVRGTGAASVGRLAPHGDGLVASLALG